MQKAPIVASAATRKIMTHLNQQIALAQEAYSEDHGAAHPESEKEVAEFLAWSAIQSAKLTDRVNGKSA